MQTLTEMSGEDEVGGRTKDSATTFKSYARCNSDISLIR